MRKQLLSALDVVRKAAACQHNASLRFYAYRFAVAFNQGACHTIVLRDQLLHGARKPHRNVAIHRGLRQATRERVAVRESHPATMREHVEEMLAQSLRDVDERGERLERAHEMFDVGP